MYNTLCGEQYSIHRECIMCETSKKGDIAVAKTIADLTVKEYNVLVPISEHLKFDLVAYKDNRFYRIQVKYSAENPHIIRNSTTRQSSGQTIITKYTDDDFDYYAIYLRDKDCVVYPSVKFKGSFIRTELPTLERTVNGGFYWYEDMLDFSDILEKKTRKSFGLTSEYIPRKRKELPDKQILEKEIWEVPAWTLCEKYKVSDKTIKSWCDELGIICPPRGHFLKKTRL